MYENIGNHKNILKILGDSRRTSGFCSLRGMIPSISCLFLTSGLRRGIYGHPHIENHIRS